jgi:hypothetical protein
MHAAAAIGQTVTCHCEERSDAAIPIAFEWGIAAPLRSQQETRFAFGVTFIVMAGLSWLVPAMTVK